MSGGSSRQRKARSQLYRYPIGLPSNQTAPIHIPDHSLSDFWCQVKKRLVAMGRSSAMIATMTPDTDKKSALLGDSGKGWSSLNGWWWRLNIQTGNL
jgi:hypothetical protein